ncbi:hypothetical protein ACFOEK_17585 [Litoribrevibacter euphylliae]|uniref:Uncharacterized protein n=1 Tax=Litoribrevibacter euphylliae TaxID=1834034 RepID=A0ABV7HL25_9GAMM
MGLDYVALANKTKKEYIRPSPYISHSSISHLVNDWFLSSSVLYLISEPHIRDKPKGLFSETFCGSWANSEFIWVSDYDEIYDGNPEWQKDWSDLSCDAYIVLMEQSHRGMHDLFASLTVNPDTIRLLGYVYEQTKSEELESKLIDVFGKGWQNWYYFSVSHKHKQIKDWPNINSEG